jgi:F-type H+-transporting ATPase subunit b
MENLGIDLKLMTAQLVNFAIFFFVFKKFIAAPFMNYMKKSKEEDETRASFASEIEKRQEKLDEEDKKLSRERKKTLETALLESKKEAEDVRKELIEDAKKEAADIVAKGHAQVIDERKELYKDLRKQIAQVSSLVVEKALNEYLTDDAKRSITQNIVKHIPADSQLEN